MAIEHKKKLNTSPMNWTYIAGFFDGEGCIARNRKKLSSFKYWQIQITQTQKDVLNKIQKFVGYGNIYQRNYSHPLHNTLYVFRITKREEILSFLSNVLPYVIVKRKQAQQILADPWIHRIERKMKIKEVNAAKRNVSVPPNLTASPG